MTADLRLLPAGIADDRSRALLALMDRLDAIDLAPLLMTRVDSVTAGALIHLAAQYHVLGFEGFDLATDDAAQRALLKQAIALHRTKGTPFAIKQALARIGYESTSIDERTGRRRRDGRYRHNGELRHAGEPGWATFRVSIDVVDDTVAVTSELQQQLIAVINAWKNARSHLDALAIAQPFADVISPPGEDFGPYPAYADGHYFADGSVFGIAEAAPDEVHAPIDGPVAVAWHTLVVADGSFVADGSVLGAGEIVFMELVA